MSNAVLLSPPPTRPSLTLIPVSTNSLVWCISFVASPVLPRVVFLLFFFQHLIPSQSRCDVYCLAVSLPSFGYLVPVRSLPCSLYTRLLLFHVIKDAVFLVTAHHRCRPPGMDGVTMEMSECVTVQPDIINLVGCSFLHVCAHVFFKLPLTVKTDLRLSKRDLPNQWVT